MKPTIKMIEDLSLNAWPSHQIQLYDGWLLRFFLFLYSQNQLCGTDWTILDPYRRKN